MKGIVPKKTTMPALQGILVKDGFLIASNTEMTVKVKLEGAENEYFIIPERAFDLISNLPDGEMNISVTGKNIITIQVDKIKNTRQWIRNCFHWAQLGKKEANGKFRRTYF